MHLTFKYSHTASIVLFALSGFLSCFLFKGGTNIAYMPALFFTATALCLAWKRTQIIKIPLHTFIYALFWLYAGLSFFWSNAPYPTLATWVIITIAPLAYLLGRTLLSSSPKAPNALLYILLLIGGVIFLYGIWDFNVGRELRMNSVFSNPNTCAAFLVLLLLPCVACLINRQDHKYIWGILSAFFICALVLTGSRSGLLTALFSLSLLFLFSSRSARQKKRQYGFLLIVTYALIGAVAVWYDFQFFTRILTSFSEISRDSTHGRLTIWAGSWDLVKDHFFYGTGLGTFFLEYPAYRLPRDPSIGDWAHWDGLQIWAETGIFGTMLWHSFWASLLYSFIKNRHSLSIFALIGGIGCFSIFFQSHITYLYTLPAILFILGLYLSFYDHALKDPCVTSLSKRPSLVIISLVTLLAIQSASSMFLAQRVNEDILTSKTHKALQKVNWIERFGSPSFYEHYLSVGARGDFISLDKAKKACIPCARPFLMEGILYSQKGQIDLAYHALRQALTKKPSDPSIRIHFIRLLMSNSQWEETQEIARKAFDYPLTPSQRDYFLNVINKQKTKED